MVGPQRSLVTRVYLYATAVLVASFAVAFFVGQALVDEGQVEAMQQFGTDQAAFIGREVESSIRQGQPAPDRMADLSSSLHVDLNFVPWGARADYPTALTTDKVFSLPGRRPGVWRRDYWVRMDQDGRPIGAVKIEFKRPRPPARRGQWLDWLPGQHRLPFMAALVWMGLLALMIVPPLWFWVVKPLRRMVGVADRLGHGDLATPVPIDRKDEFGELERAFEAMRQRVLQMLAARERLLRDISHELRAPLSRMAIALPLLREESESPYLDRLERDMRAMDGLIGEVLALARGRSPEALQRGPVDLAEVARALLDERQVVLAQRPTAMWDPLESTCRHASLSIL